jgi:ribosome maturation factor RimP
VTAGDPADDDEGDAMPGQGQGTSGEDLPGRLVALAEPVAADLGVDLVDVEVKGPRNRRVVRLVADAEGGLDIDRIAELSRAVGDAIDDVVPGSYTLEVTSPGTDRPLRRLRDFERNVGRDVRIQRTQQAAADAPGEVTGTVVAATDGTVTLDVDGEQVAVPIDDVDHGKVQLPW